MKKIKNLIGIVLLVTIITFISIGQSFAAIQADSTTDIVINNVTAGDKFIGYKIIDLNYDVNTNNYTRTWNAAFEPYFISKGYSSVDDFLEITDESVRRELFAGLLYYINNTYPQNNGGTAFRNPDLSLVTSGNENNIVFSNVPMGAYYIIPQATKDVYQTMVIPVEPTVDETSQEYILQQKTIDAKKSEISIDIVSNKNSATINDIVEFTITVDLPSTYQADGTNRIINIQNIIETGLVIQGTPVVQMIKDGTNSNANTDSYNLTVSDDNTQLDLSIGDTQYGNNWIGAEKLIITYNAVLTKDAPITTVTDGIKDAIDSSVVLEYSMFPYISDILDVEKTDKASVETYGIRIHKIAKNTNTSLANASFKLYSDEDCTNLITDIVFDANGNIINTNVATTDSNGIALFQRLAEGTYYIKETKAPSGYTLDSKPKSITISSTNIANDGFKEIEIVNTKGILLPTTGGRSAMIITIVGMLLIIISIVLLILFAKKTKNKEKK